MFIYLCLPFIDKKLYTVEQANCCIWQNKLITVPYEMCTLCFKICTPILNLLSPEKIVPIKTAYRVLCGLNWVTVSGKRCCF